MELIPWLIALAFAIAWTKQRYQSRPKALPNAPLDNMLDAPKSRHRLRRTYQTYMDYGLHRIEWHWECTCNTTSAEQTEEAAVNAFINHRILHDNAAESHYKRLYEQTAAEFAQFKEDCYCKDIRPTNFN